MRSLRFRCLLAGLAAFPALSASAALPNGTQSVLPSTYTADSAIPANTWSNTYFTIGATTTVSGSTTTSKVTVDSATPSGAYFETTSYSNSTTPTFALIVTAKSATLQSFKLSSITLKGYDPADTWTNVQITATLAGGGTISNTAQSFSGNSADYIPNLTTGTFSTTADITSFTVTFKLAPGCPANTDMTLNAFSISGAKPPAPTASTTAASSIGTTSATLGGTATADAGGEAITARGVVYSTTNTTPTIGGAGVTNVTIGSGAGSFSQSVTSLTAGTLHYFRAYATNAGGTGYGTVSTFTTSTDQDGTVTAGTSVTEPVVLPTTATTSGAAVNLFDFKITDGGTSDGIPLTISQVVVSTSGTGPFSKVTWLLSGPDATNVTGTYSSGTNTITFSGLSISVANASNETYVVKGYYNDNTNLTENQTFILSVTGGTSSFTVGSSGTRMVASQSAVNNGTGSKVGVTATQLLFTTQPAGSTSGSALTTQPVVKATDAASNVDVDFTGNVTLGLGSGAGSLSGTVTKAGVSGVATFTDVAYSATADQQAFTLATSNSSSLTNATSSSVTSDVVATALQFSTQPAPLSIGSGVATAFSTVPVVRAVNGGGVVDTAARSITLTVTNTSGGAPAGTVNALGGVSGDTDGSATIVTIAASSGVATFTGLSVTYTNDSNTANSIALRATSSGLTAVSSSTMTSTIAPSITSSLAAGGTYGTAISTYTITATHSPTSYSASGLPAGLSVNTTNGQITGTPTTNGTFNVTIGATNAGGTGTATLVFTIAKAPLSITGVAANNKTYDGTTGATLDVSSAALSGAVNGDSLTLDSSGATATFSSKDVGTGKSVSVSGFAVSGTNSGNYTLSQPAGLTANITAKALTLTGVNAVAKTYDATTTAPLSGTAALQSAEAAGTGSTSDGKPYTGDTVALTGTASATFADRHVGTTKAVTLAGLSLTGAQAGNYTLTLTGYTADITTKALTVSGLTASNKVYDAATTATLSGTAALQSAQSPGAGTTSDGKPYTGDTLTLGGTASGAFATKTVGTAKPVTVTGLALSGAESTNYSLTQPTGLTANITVATLTVSGITAANRVYDTTTTATLSTASASLDGVQGSDSVTADYASASGSFASKTVGSGKTVTVSGITISGTDSGNYALTQPTTTANITAAGLTVTGITAANKVYDATTAATLTTTSAALSGVLGSDVVTLDVSSAAGAFANKTVGTGKTVSVSGLTISGADSGNYSLTQPTTTANVTAAALTVSGITANNKVYDSTTTAALVTGSAALNGVISGDTVALDVSAAAGTFDTKNTGTGKTVTVAGLTLSGTDAGNYTVTQPTTTANITAKALTVTADDKTRVYNTANPTFTATITGFAGTETSSVLTGSPELTTTATTSSLPNTYAITAAIGTLAANNGNYTFTFVNGTLTITALTYASWKAQVFSSAEQADSAISGVGADPDYDGIVNLLEYAFDLDPRSANRSGLPTSSLLTVSSQRHLAITFTRSKVTSDLTYAVQASADLGSWSAATPVEVSAVDNGDTETVTTRDATTVASATRRFLRVSVTDGSTTRATTPIGFVSLSALANSDTVISLPLARASVYVDNLSAVSSNVLTVAGTPGWSTNQFVKSLPGQPDTFYVQFKTGTAAGRFYTVTANDATSLTVDWNGETAAAASGDQFELVPYWTLVSLFPAADAGASFTETTDTNSHQSEVRMLDQAFTGTNLPIAASYFFYNGNWRATGQSATDSFDSTVIPPDTFFHLRNAAAASTLTVLGSVTTGALSVPINARGGTSKQDNAIALRFAGTVTLAQSNLVGSGAFQASTSTLLRKDELHVFDNTVAGYNKTPVAIYYYYNGGWRRAGAAVTTNYGSDAVFTPGAGVVVRKAGTGAGAQISYWKYDVTGL